MARVAVVQYPGSNCDLDALEILKRVEKVKTDLVWHKDLDEDRYDAYVLPGGFSYGDYLRAGAIAATSPSLKIIQEAAEEGKPVLGIPGYPISAFITFTLFANPLIRLRQGLGMQRPERIEAILSRQVASPLGQEEFVRVKVGLVGEKAIATPLSRGAGTTFRISKAATKAESGSSGPRPK